jgi:ribosomal protein S18 acetylase RimI-like enzyme
MKDTVEFCLNKAAEAAIASHLLDCDADFIPPLSERVEIDSYASKIAGNAMRFEAWADGMLVGLVAAYCNDCERRVAHITNVSVLRRWQGERIASRLLEQCIGHVKEHGFEHVELEVDVENAGAITLYEKNGFVINAVNGRTALMHLNVRRDV